MKLLIPILLLFTSCITQKKVNTWLNNHPTEAAGYCADKFPPDTISTTDTVSIDSSSYYDAYMNMAYLADSLFFKLDSIQNLPPGERPKINIDSVRKAVDKEIRKRLKPCVDSIVHITHTVVNKAREKQLQGLIDKKDFVIAEMQVRVNDQQDKIRSQRKWFWLFWALVVAAGLYAFVKVRYKLPI